MSHPILYSQVNDPYCIRARMAIALSGKPVEIREVMQHKKPAELLAIAPDNDVPALLADGALRTSDRDIMRWALGEETEQEKALLDDHRGFIYIGEAFWYATYHPEHREQHAKRDEMRADGEVYLAQYEKWLSETAYLFGEQIGIADVGIYPFVRRFMRAEEAWMQGSPYPELDAWIRKMDARAAELHIMHFEKAWESTDDPTFLPR